MKKKQPFSVSVITNLLILAMLVLISVLTLNFESQYVFGFKSDQVIYNGNKNSNNVTLMINVYWGNEFIEPMLGVFESYDVITTFFVGGSWAEKYPELLQKIHEQGHEIGNHGYFHKDHNKLSYDQNYEEINVTHKVVKSTLNYDMNLFAPPSGAYNKTTLTAANELGYKTIMWSKDTIDWRDKDENLVFTRATKNVAGGDLILMHPTAHTLQALPKILDYYKANNLTACNVSTNIA